MALRAPKPLRQGAAGKPRQHDIDEASGQHAGHRAGQRRNEQNSADRPDRQQRRAGGLQGREQPEVLPKAQHRQMQLGAALEYRHQGAADGDARGDDARRENASARQQAKPGTGGEGIEDHRALRRLVGAGVEPAAGEPYPFEDGDAGELADRDEERVMREFLRRQDARDQQQQHERQHGLIGIGSESDELTHRRDALLSPGQPRRTAARRYWPP